MDPARTQAQVRGLQQSPSPAVSGPAQPRRPLHHVHGSRIAPSRCGGFRRGLQDGCSVFIWAESPCGEVPGLALQRLRRPESAPNTAARVRWAARRSGAEADWYSAERMSGWRKPTLPCLLTSSPAVSAGLRSDIDRPCRSSAGLRTSSEEAPAAATSSIAWRVGDGSPAMRRPNVRSRRHPMRSGWTGTVSSLSEGSSRGQADHPPNQPSVDQYLWGQVEALRGKEFAGRIRSRPITLHRQRFETGSPRPVRPQTVGQ